MWFADTIIRLATIFWCHFLHWKYELSTRIGIFSQPNYGIEPDRIILYLHVTWTTFRIISTWIFEFLMCIVFMYVAKKKRDKTRSKLSVRLFDKRNNQTNRIVCLRDKYTNPFTAIQTEHIFICLNEISFALAWKIFKLKRFSNLFWEKPKKSSFLSICWVNAFGTKSDSFTQILGCRWMTLLYKSLWTNLTCNCSAIPRKKMLDVSI